jgi:hypothetical protein
MAKNSRLAVQATSKLSRPRTPRLSVPFFFAVGAVLIVVAAATFTKPGAVALGDARAFLEFFSGVFSLVSLSICVMVGLAATDRIILLIRHRVLLQAVHRAMALSSMLFLGIHITLKVAEAHASPVDAVVPFMAAGRGPFVIYMGLGTIASYGMIIATWTGLVRGRFAGSAHPGLWRALHVLAYAAWPASLVHGLEAGRHAKTWVTVSYILCILLVLMGLVVRLFVTWNKRLSSPKATTTGAIRPVGKLVSRAIPSASIEPLGPDEPRPRQWDYEDVPVSSIPVSPYPAGPRRDRADRTDEWVQVGSRHDGGRGERFDGGRGEPFDGGRAERFDGGRGERRRDGDRVESMPTAGLGDPRARWETRPLPDERAAREAREREEREREERAHEERRARDAQEAWEREERLRESRAREELARLEWEAGIAEREAASRTRQEQSITGARHAGPAPTDGALPRRARPAGEDEPAIAEAYRRLNPDVPEPAPRPSNRHSVDRAPARPQRHLLDNDPLYDMEPYSAPPAYPASPPYSAAPAPHDGMDPGPAPWLSGPSYQPGEEAPTTGAGGRQRRSETTSGRGKGKGKSTTRSRKSKDDVDEDFWAFMRGEALR